MCRSLFIQTKKETPCAGCDHNPPALAAENFELYELLKATTTQWKISVMGEVLGLDYNAVFQVAAILEIEIDHDKLKALQAVEWAVISKTREAKQHEQ